MKRSRKAFALGLVAPLLVVSGCSGGDPQPKMAPSVSAVGSPSVSPSASPDRVHHLDPTQTVRAWINAQNHALHTGDTDRLRALSSNPCQACNDFIDPIEKVFADGGHFTTSGWRLVRAKERASKKIPRVVDTAVSIAGGRTVLKAGGAPVVYKETKHIIVFKVMPDGSGWAVSFIGFLS